MFVLHITQTHNIFAHFIFPKRLKYAHIYILYYVCACTEKPLQHTNINDQVSIIYGSH